MTAPDVAELIESLELVPHPEGGYYRQTFLLPGEAGERPRATAIYFLITDESFSALHRMQTEELYHFYLGDGVEMLHLGPDGTCDRVLFGNDLKGGERPQVLVPAGVWQGSRLREGGRFALFGTTMTPGFELEDFELGDRRTLCEVYPQHARLIERYTRPGVGSCR